MNKTLLLPFILMAFLSVIAQEPPFRFEVLNDVMGPVYSSGNLKIDQLNLDDSVKALYRSAVHSHFAYSDIEIERSVRKYFAAYAGKDNIQAMFMLVASLGKTNELDNEIKHATRLPDSATIDLFFLYAGLFGHEFLKKEYLDTVLLAEKRLATHWGKAKVEELKSTFAMMAQEYRAKKTS